MNLGPCAASRPNFGPEHADSFPPQQFIRHLGGIYVIRQFALSHDSDWSARTTTAAAVGVPPNGATPTFRLWVRSTFIPTLATPRHGRLRVATAPGMALQPRDGEGPRSTAPRSRRDFWWTDDGGPARASSFYKHPAFRMWASGFHARKSKAATAIRGLPRSARARIDSSIASRKLGAALIDRGASGAALMPTCEQINRT